MVQDEVSDRDDASSLSSTRNSDERSRPKASWPLLGLFILFLIAGLAYGRFFLTPLIFGFLLALVFSPVRRTICRTGLAAGWAAAAIVVSLVTTLFVVGYLLSTPVTGWIADAPEIGERLEERVRDIRTSLGGEGGEKSVGEVVADIQAAAAPSETDTPTVRVEEDGLMARLAATAPIIVVQAILILVLLFFLLASGDMFYEKLVHVIPRFRDKKRAMQIAHDIERKLSRYLLTISMINAGLGLSIGLAMWALGMPDPILFGIIGWLFNYVPYIGAITGSLLALCVGLLTFEGIWPAVIPALAYYGLTSIEGQFVTPYLVGRNLKLNTVVVFITIAFWAWLWSIVGMLIAVPVLVTIRTICGSIPNLQPIADFLSARGAEVEDEPVQAARERKLVKTTEAPPA